MKMSLGLRKVVRSASAGFALVLVLAACGNSGGSGTAAKSGNSGTTDTSKPLTNFTSAVFQSELYLPDYVAKDKGFDAAHGIDMHFVTPSSGSAAAQLMLAG
ncbi:MAG: hypothetical protein ACYCS7_00950, partial [Acidimicrobiales bacterium]